MTVRSGLVGEIELPGRIAEYPTGETLSGLENQPDAVGGTRASGTHPSPSRRRFYDPPPCGWTSQRVVLPLPAAGPPSQSGPAPSHVSSRNVPNHFRVGLLYIQSSFLDAGPPRPLKVLLRTFLKRARNEGWLR
jgi:hypothetical protein